jgi:hypothetical protein
MSSFSTAAQTAAPAWVRARALSIYLLVFMGGMAVGRRRMGRGRGSFFGVTNALTFAGLGLLIGVPASLRYRLIDGDDLSLVPSVNWPDPVVVIEPKLEEGPVLVSDRVQD